MRKVFTILFIASTFCLTAQDVTLTTNDSLHLEETVTELNASFEHKTYVESNMFSTAEVKWEIDSAFYPSEWEASLCDNEICVDIAVQDTNIFTLAASATGELKMGYIPNETAGNAYVRVRIKAEGSTEEYLYMIYTANIEVDIESGISTIDASSLSIFPNPVIDQVNVNFDSNLEVNLATIYNVIGKKVKTVALADTQNSINTSDLEKGIYIIKIHAKDQSIFHTQTFVKR
ncbi:MAG: hypothetical protein ACI8ZX_001573 [Planctomycetota bacterium]|jgi:hypothetical protein